MRILVTGGCGYVGSALIPHLLANGHSVTVIDPQWFGDGFLPDNENLDVIKGDIRDEDLLKGALFKINAVIHLGGMTSDWSCQRKQGEAYSTNVEGFQALVRAVTNSKVRRFIFPSSVAAYGNTTSEAGEDDPLRPTTVYGGHKLACEEMLWRLSQKNLKIFILRPAGVFGAAPRMRFDLTVNQMTLSAVREGVIHVHGGEQVRPHVHLRDLIDVFLRLLTSNISSDIFNVVHVNQKVIKTANIIAEITGAKVAVEPRTDDRSYEVDGRKLGSKLSIRPRRGIEDAVAELASKLKSGYYPDAPNDTYLNRV